VADHTPEQVDRVAQAIADEGWYLGFWRDEADDHQRNRYRRMARAALDAATPELIAEIERLRAGGAWVEHVERQRAMKRERDGECICNTGPDTDGPDEFCPWHGRRYSELVDIIVEQQAQINAGRRYSELVDIIVEQQAQINAGVGSVGERDQP
jgi:hypothetical protein